jgi:hypothetical protein
MLSVSTSNYEAEIEAKKAVWDQFYSVELQERLMILETELSKANLPVLPTTPLSPVSPVRKNGDDLDKQIIKVYSEIVGAPSKSFAIKPTTTASDMVDSAMKKFRIPVELTPEYCLMLCTKTDNIVLDDDALLQPLAIKIDSGNELAKEEISKLILRKRVRSGIIKIHSEVDNNGKLLEVIKTFNIDEHVTVKDLLVSAKAKFLLKSSPESYECIEEYNASKSFRFC